MPRSDAMFAVADDLTGAAEIAALGHRAGWHSQVVTQLHEFADADLTVLDTDTRLAPPAEAGRRVAAAGALAAKREWRLVYKKTDSVLRGAVLTELTALAGALQRKVVLFVPCNPSLGRTTCGGRYFVHGVPLDQTAFARDPHHPAHTSNIAELLGPPGAVQVAAPGTNLPDRGVVVGEATTSEAVRNWATRIGPETLPAGGGEFFSAVLRAQIGDGPQKPATPFAPAGPTLLIGGSTAAPRRAADSFIVPLEFIATGDPSGLAAWVAPIVSTLARQAFVAVSSPTTHSSHPAAPARLRDAFAFLVQEAIARHAVGHLMIEGGATAAAVLRTLGWTPLTVAREWAQGVVTLRPSADRNLSVTMKPGSYHWPDALWSHVQAPR